MPNLHLSDDECNGCRYEDELPGHPECEQCLEKVAVNDHWTPNEDTIAICKKIIAMTEGASSDASE